MARKKTWDPIYNIPDRALPSAPRPRAGSLPRASSRGSSGDSGEDSAGHPYGARGASSGSGSSSSSSLGGGSLFDSLLSAASGSSGVPSSSGVRSGSASGGGGIQFGRPSSLRSAAAAGSTWSSLLGQLSSGGVGSFLGLGGIASDIAGLFGLGGKSAPPPLVEFRLPGSVSESVSFGSRANGGGVASTSVAWVAPQPSVTVPSNVGAAIANAVKQQLLQSSSLADVIAEL